MKCVCITTVHKGVESSEVYNYRPISVMHVFGKVFEKCMHKRLTSFLNKFAVLSNTQFGFGEGKSCVVASQNRFVYKGLDEREIVFSIFLDLRKAYDIVNHKVLIDKLQALVSE